MEILAGNQIWWFGSGGSELPNQILPIFLHMVNLAGYFWPPAKFKSLSTFLNAWFGAKWSNLMPANNYTPLYGIGKGSVLVSSLVRVCVLVISDIFRI